MSTPARRRLFHDLKKLKNEENNGLLAVPNENNMMSWEAIIYILFIQNNASIFQSNTIKTRQVRILGKARPASERNTINVGIISEI